MTTVPGMDGAEAIAHAGLRVCALKDGAVHCWGYQHERHAIPACDAGACPTPSVIPGLEHDVVELKAVRTHACAKVEHGREKDLVCWGPEVPGAPRDRKPGLVRFESDSRADKVQAFDLAYGRTCAVFDRGFPRPGPGRLVCRGNSSSSADEYDVALDLWPGDPLFVRAGRYNTCAGGSCWGLNHKGQLGIPPRDHRTVELAARHSIALMRRPLHLGSASMCGIVEGELRCSGATSQFLSASQDFGPVTVELPRGRDACLDC